MTKSKALINIPKLMVLVIWGVHGPALVEIVPPNLSVSAKCFCEFAIPHLEANLKKRRPKQGLKHITFHCDNAPSHTAKVAIAKSVNLE
jgi:hypothetical protein